LFKSVKDVTKLKSFVNTCLQFGQVYNPDNEGTEIYSKTVDALKEIARESKINEIRIKELFRIRLD
jgi:hypothetical protein